MLRFTQATKKTWRIENERSFYQKQAVEAMQARDRAEAEASRVQQKATSLEALLTQKDTELRAEQSELIEVRQRLQGLHEEADGLRIKAKVASQVPQLRLDLQECRAALEREQQAHSRATVCANLLLPNSPDRCQPRAEECLHVPSDCSLPLRLTPSQYTALTAPQQAAAVPIEWQRSVPATRQVACHETIHP